MPANPYDHNVDVAKRRHIVAQAVFTSYVDDWLAQHKEHGLPNVCPHCDDGARVLIEDALAVLLDAKAALLYHVAQREEARKQGLSS